MKKSEATVERRVPPVFNPEQIGRSLKEVGVDVIETESASLVSRWFHSGNDVDLFIWTDEDKNLIKHQVSFFGQIVEWNIFEGVKTGAVVSEEGKEGEEVSEIIHFDSAPQQSSINQAMEFLRYLNGLQPNQLESLLTNLRDGRKANPNAKSEFVRRYGRDFKDNRRPSFWKRVQKWFSSF